MTRHRGPDHDDPRDDRLDPTGLIERIAAATADRPVGLLMVAWDQPAGDGLDRDLDRDRDDDRDHDRLVERSVLFAVAACAERTDLITAATSRQVAVLRAPLTAPAAAEGLAHLIAQRLDAELDHLATELGRPMARWAIGVAIDRPTDRAVDLLRAAESALNDAWLLGGRLVVASDEGDRELRDPPAAG